MRRRTLLGGLAGGGLLAAAAGRRASAATPRRPLAMPPPLAAGSRVVAVAPGTWWEEPEREAGDLRARFTAAGWTLQIPEETMGRWRWFSASDRERLRQWQQASADPSVAAVAAVAGGWGSARLLEIGWQPARRPLWLVGFSDVSALLLAQFAAGLGGAVHGGLGGDPAAWNRLVALLRGQPVAPLMGAGWRPGVASGPLVVTNLTVATHLIGTRWFPDLRGCVLVLEDVGEAPYRVDRMLTHWRTSGVLRGVAGIGLGHFRWKEDDVLPGDLTLEEVLMERLSGLGVPVVGRLPVGHGRPNLALPLGRLARLDGDRGRLELL
ncbi:MAG: LD-carboxypeptidase [Synechococcaceae cyanobacterium]|nr:LD-carboxypeptidase [Synechococcaceae cyanobacterium]